VPEAVQKRAGIREHLAGDELFLYDAQGEELTVLNKTALLIWSLCDGAHSDEEIRTLLAEIYPEAPPETVAADVDSTLQSFRDQGLLEPTD
jgi:hypothetical protein